MMKNLLTFLFVLFFSSLLFAQPVNDDCSGLIELGIAPVCVPTDVYTNVDATPSDIGFGNIPPNFNGGVINNDVWFSFVTPADIEDFKITLFASPDGVNNPILNPQIALYRGSCQVDGLSELISASAENGGSLIQLSILGLTPNTTYYIRVDAYSATALPNWGDFTLCIEEYIPDIIIGTETNTSACSGTLYDSGGPDGDYQDGEDLTFTICPNEAHSCITLELVDFEIEGADDLDIHAGNSTAAPLITSIDGQSNGSNLNIYVESSCVTFHFVTDGSVVFSGFEINWQCSPAECGGSSFDNPVVINNLPYSDDASTCEGGINSTVVPCLTPFTTGASVIYEFETEGGFCAALASTNGTGIYVLDGHPDDPATTCQGESISGFGGFNFEVAGTYYIVVASPEACSDFTLTIEEAACPIIPSLEAALCNPLNGCIEAGGVPSVFVFEQGFQDIDIVTGVNGGCWGGLGFEPDLYWFTIQASNDGNFGFILSGANGIDSDIDFNVWGPFNSTEVCDDKEGVIDFISNNEPIRSSYAPGDIHTGLADIHPDSGEEVVDAFDCGTPGTADAGGDNFVSTIPVIEGEVYVVLVNDFGDAIAENGISIDWSPSTPGVLDTVGIHLDVLQDTVICPGEPLLLAINSPVENVVWLDPNGYLSCTECPTPIAIVPESTTFEATVNAVCYSQTVSIKVNVVEADAGDDISVCLNEDIVLSAGSSFEFVDYLWTDVAGLTFSCIDCPDPTVIAAVAGTYTLTVSVITPECTDSDELTVTVLPQEAPDFSVIEDQQLCAGESVSIGDANPGNDLTINWTSVPNGFSSSDANPNVTPAETTIYYVTVDNNSCPNPSIDSVKIDIVEFPVLSVEGDVTVCAGETVVLGNVIVENDVTYSWSGPGDFEDDSDPNTIVTPTGSGVFTLLAEKNGCDVSLNVNVNFIDYAIHITNPDTVNLCIGDQVDINVEVTPNDLIVQWFPMTTLSAPTGTMVTATPNKSTTYYGTVSFEHCTYDDSIFVQVDSLPTLDLMANPEKEVYCEGDIVQLISSTYETYLFPSIEHQWLEGPGYETPDSLFNMVITAQDTFNYQRITTVGLCSDTSEILILVDKVPELSIVPAESSVCPGVPITLTTVYSGVGELTWTYNEESGDLGTEDPFAPIGTAISTMNISVTSDDNCPASAGAVINVDGTSIPVTLTATPTQILAGGTVVLTAEVIGLDPTEAVTYEWYQGSILIGTTSVPTFSATNVQSNGTTFAVWVTPEVNCAGAANVEVEIIEIEVPNVFTPNNDNNNDIFKLYYPDFINMKVESFKVFNRWGQVVFDAQDNTGWDGMYKGKPAASDVYIYHIIADSDGARVEKSGELTLLR